MAKASVGERAIVLDDWPQPAAGAPEPRVLADDASLSLTYRTCDDRYAVVRFPHCSYLTFGAPNDEALGGHPLFGCGLRHYSVHEVRGFALVRALGRRNSVHPRHNPALFLNSRHYIFTFQDSTLECVVPGAKWWAPTVEVYSQAGEAEAAWRAKRPAESGAAADRAGGR